MNKDLLDELEEIIRMYWQEEKDHWEELECPDKHIFLSVNAIKNWLIAQHKGDKDEVSKT